MDRGIDKVEIYSKTYKGHMRQKTIVIKTYENDKTRNITTNTRKRNTPKRSH